MPYCYPKDSTAEQINRITNLLIEREAVFWPSADRKFQTPSEQKLKQGFVTANVNSRSIPPVQHFRVDEDLIPRTRRIDDVMATPLPPLRKKKTQVQHSTAASLALGKADPPHVVTPLGVCLDFPERASEDIGLNVHIQHRLFTRKYPLLLDSVSKFAENFQAVLGINPYGKKKMFDSVSR